MKLNGIVYWFEVIVGFLGWDYFLWKRCGGSVDRIGGNKYILKSRDYTEKWVIIR